MKIALISSKKDEASMNIRNHLLGYFKETDDHFDDEIVYSYKNIKLYTINEELIFYEDADTKINADFFIFLSKHKSKAQIPTLSVHSIGNWNENELGGRKNQLVFSSALMLRKTFLFLNVAGKGSGYEIVYEATHHGPYLEKPAFFIEIGSSEREWNDSKTGKIIAESLIKSLNEENQSAETAICIGGLHTCPEFNKVVLKNKIAISHICPKYMLSKLTKEMVEEAIKKTIEKVDYAILDWKGLGKEKQKIVKILGDLGLAYKRTTNL